MIHSMSGGVIREKKFCDFAKVRTETGEKFWFVSTIFDLKVGDWVVVPFGKDNIKAQVLRIDKNVSEQMSPIPMKRAKEILQKIY